MQFIYSKDQIPREREEAPGTFFSALLHFNIYNRKHQTGTSAASRTKLTSWIQHSGFSDIHLVIHISMVTCSSQQNRKRKFSFFLSAHWKHAQKKKKRKIRKRQFTGNPPSWPLYSGLLTYQKWSRDTEYLACSKKQQKFLSKTACLSAGMPASVSNTPSLLFSFSQNNFLVNKYRARL